MSKQIALQVTMELRSDTIFGSGYSLPGAEDITVCRDDAGWPYLKGSTFKGLLRESAENLLCWTDGTEADLDALFGKSGWDGADDERRIHTTELTLQNRPNAAEDCFSSRMFTSVENGTVKDGTLRMAQCVNAGLCFAGAVYCAEQDADLLKRALAGIKWVGTMRSRGFGRVCVRGGKAERATSGSGIANARCIRYRLHTESPVLITDLSRSSEFSYETKGYIPGSAVRGMLASTLSAEDPAWFAEHRVALLSERTRFLDAVPVVGDGAPLPSIKGFYEGKAETGEIESVVPNGSFTPGFKRAKLGAFCSIEGDTLRYWSASTGGSTRIGRGKHAMFQTRQLDAGQDFEGYIQLDDDALSAQLSACLHGTVWLGADRWGGFGRCTVTLCEAVEAPRWADTYGVSEKDAPGEVLYMLAVSPLSMLDACGDPCGLNEAALGDLLGVTACSVERCSTSLVEQGGYNRTWRSRAPMVQYYDRGSLFRLRLAEAPTLARIRAVERQGLGIRRAEGFGQVLFLSAARFEAIHSKTTVKQAENAVDAKGAALRRSKYTWIMNNAGHVDSGASRSQIGTIQTLCEKALSKDGDTTELLAFFDKSLNKRGTKHGERFKGIHALVSQVLDTPLEQTLGVACEDSVTEKLRLLIMLFDYSRKEVD